MNMMFRYILILFALLPATIPAQESGALQEFLISAIEIEGNEKTHPDIILREMKTRVGSVVRISDLQYDANRIESLGLFSRVQMEFFRQDEGVGLRISVSELWYIFPVPLLFFNDRDFKLDKLSYGGSVLHVNFRGRAEVMEVSGWYGYNPGVFLRYKNPWFLGKARLFAEARFFASRVRNKSFDILNQEVDERQVGFLLGIGKRLTLTQNIRAYFGMRRITLNPAVAGQTLTPGGSDFFPEASLTWFLDSRDLVWYPTRGSSAALTVAKTGGFNARYINYGRISFDARHYRKVYRDVVLAGYASGRFSFGKLPVYDRLYFGYKDRLRGYFFDRLAGERQLQFSGEVRFPILPVRYFDLDDDRIGQYGQNLKFGISGAFFVDTGSLWLQDEYVLDYGVRNQNGDLVPVATQGEFGLQTRPDRWLTGVGASLLLHLPYVNIVRLETAFDADRNIQFIFDAGISF